VRINNEFAMNLAMLLLTSSTNSRRVFCSTPTLFFPLPHPKKKEKKKKNLAYGPPNSVCCGSFVSIEKEKIKKLP
jgi:hypothetical protein